MGTIGKPIRKFIAIPTKVPVQAPPKPIEAPREPVPVDILLSKISSEREGVV